jgi:glycosyltransferase involved in cell wall biosynthesis/peptidoglycan/xylan/chitin deacetylase (PgdA/CDA1 family)
MSSGVSVIVTSFNYGQYVGDALESILAQSVPASEVIVIDDGSTDDTAARVRSYPDLQYVYQTNAGVSAARNRGIAKSTGDFLVFLDADDLLLPRAIECNLRTFRENPAVGMVAGHYRYINADKTVQFRQPFHGVTSDFYRHLLIDNFIGMHGAVMYKRAAISDVGGFDEALRRCEDYDVYLKVAKSHGLACHDEIVAEYRRHGNGLSNEPVPMLAMSHQVLSRQYPHVLARNDKDLMAAYRRGMISWRNRYGRELAQKVVSNARSGNFGLARLQLAHLLPHTPMMAGWMVRRLLFSNPLGRRVLSAHENWPESCKARDIARWLYRRSGRHALILVYHRVAEPTVDPWKLCVSPENFAAQMSVLRRIFFPVALPQLTHDLAERRLRHRSVVVTFDDGYLDNYQAALPSIEAEEIPTTFFIVPGMLGRKHFWSDDLAHLVLGSNQTSKPFSVTAGGARRSWSLTSTAGETAPGASWRSGWRAWEPPPGPREVMFVQLWEWLVGLPAAERKHVLVALRVWAGGETHGARDDMTMTEEEVATMARHRLAEIGAHTLTHPMLTSLGREAQRREVSGSKSALEELIGDRVRSFAYPYGGARFYSAETIDLVREAGFEAACINVSGLTTKRSERFTLPRVQIQNWNGDRFEKELTAWLPA